MQYRGFDVFSGVRIMVRYLQLVLAIPVFLFAVSCSTNPTVANGGDPELVAKAQAALQQLFDTSPCPERASQAGESTLRAPFASDGGKSRPRRKDYVSAFISHANSKIRSFPNLLPAHQPSQ
ncbi:hypothetical protein PQR70_26700 [Paraburkholderia madseniana]|uniref:hypothetical protein n=1 Tax=Paraburkholderia madseniana TaxID=2599607 RepID=UPI0038B6CBAC